MRYTVVWTEAAHDQLANIWTSAADRTAVTEAADLVDDTLRKTPDIGAIESDGYYHLIVAPLLVTYDVSHDDCLVEVVWFEYVG